MSPSLYLLIIIAIVAGLGYWIYRLKYNLYEAFLYVQNREREREMTFSFLNRIGEQITTDHDLEKTFELVLEFCRSATKADSGAIFLRDLADPDLLKATVVQGLFPPLHEVNSQKLFSKRKYLSEFVKKETMKMGEGIIGHVAEQGESILIPHAKDDERVPKFAQEVVELDGIILVPVAIQKMVKGVIVLINKRDETNMDATFDEVDLDLVIAIADQAAVTVNIVQLYEQLAEKQRMEQELRIATEFQRLLLPRKMPELENVAIAGFSQPALEVGGDYYDVLNIDENHLGVIVGDVSGKGIPGALVMATLRSAFRAESRRDLSSRDVLRRINKTMLADTKESVFVSAVYAIINLQTSELKHSRAGHEPIMCVGKKKNEVTEFEPEGMVLGMVGNDIFDFIEEETIMLSDYEMVVLYTDGVTEAMSDKSEEYGKERLEQALFECPSENPKDVIDYLLADIQKFTKGIPQHDDITLVVLRWKR